MDNVDTILFKDIDEPGLNTLEVYQRRGGYEMLRKALKMEPQAILEELLASNVRGRGGAGFGRFGQVVTRVLNGLRIRATLIDHDPNQIETVRRFGIKAYYGDATRMDVLAAAGAAKARLLIVAIDDSEAAMRMAKRVRQRYPELKLLVRAHSRTDAYEYFEMGVPAVREVFGSSLDAAEAALRALDYGPVAARRVVQRFRRHDEDMLAEQAPHRKETKRLIALQQQGRRDIEQLLAAEARTPGRS